MKVQDLPGKKVLLDGNEAAAVATYLAKVQVIAGYPITPSTKAIETLFEFCHKKDLAAEFIAVESEHSAMAALVGASSAGVRTFTATSSHGLALMHEVLHWASGARLPIVLANADRALGAPWNILCEMTDSLSQRDTGWIQFYCASCQEILDTILQAFRIAEKSSLPAMVCYEGFYLSHRSEPVLVPTLEDVARFLPNFEPEIILDPKYPFNFSGQDHHGFSDLRKNQREAMKNIEFFTSFWAFKDFAEIFGRNYGAVETYNCNEKTDLILATIGTAAGTIRYVIDKNGLNNVGLARLRMFRPFPKQEVRKALAGAKKIAVVERDISPGIGGIIAQEIRNALYGESENPTISENIVGLGGDDISPDIIEKIIDDALDAPQTRQIVNPEAS